MMLFDFRLSLQLIRSRGKSLLEKVVKGQVCHCDTNTVWKLAYLVVFSLLTYCRLLQSVQINKVLSNALEWGVKILYIDGMFLLSPPPFIIFLSK